MASRKKQEDKHLQILRELVSQPNNKKCFDCGQRGPTYVNMTIGAYVCTSCSGLLRGLNPPHRIKSISMATFSATEIDFLQKHGHEVCRNTWLALWDFSHPPEPETREEQKVKDFLIKKYERKTWYSSQPKQKLVSQSVPEAKPLKQLLGETTAEIQVTTSTLAQTAPIQLQRAHPVAELHKPAKSDLLADFGSDPFGSSTQQQNQSQGFAAFGGAQDPFGQPQQQSLFGDNSNLTNQQPSKPFGGQPTPFAQQQHQQDPFGSSTPAAAFNSSAQQSSNQQPFDDPSDPFGGTTSSVPFDAFGQGVPDSVPVNSQDANGGFDFFAPDAGQSTSQPPSFNAFSSSSLPPSQGAIPLRESDRYKALSELDDVFRSSNTQSVFSTTASSSSNARRDTANQQPNPFMSPATGTSGIAMFQQQQQKTPNPFQSGNANQPNQPQSRQSFQKAPQQFNQGNFVAGGNQGFANTSQPNFAASQDGFGVAQGGTNSQIMNQQGFPSGKAAFGPNQGQVTGQQGQFAGQQGQIAAQQGQIAAHQGQIAGQQGQIAGQQGQFSGQQQGFGGQQQGFSGQQGQIAAQQGQFPGQQGQFAGQQHGFSGQQQGFGGQQQAFSGQQRSGQQQGFSGQQHSGQQQGFGGQQQGSNSRQQAFNGQQSAFGTQQDMTGQQFMGLSQGFGANQPAGFQGANTGMPGQISGQMPGQMPGQISGQMAGGFGNQQQQPFGTWGQPNNKGGGAFGMGGLQAGVSQKSTNPFM